MMTDHELLEQHMNNVYQLDIYDKSHIKIMSEMYALQDELENFKHILIILIILVFITFLLVAVIHNKTRKMFKKLIGKEDKIV